MFHYTLKHVAALLFTLTTLSACGEHETNPPAIPLTGSSATSTIVDSHVHTVTIPFSDPGGASQVNYRSSTSNGHSHVIALSIQQFADLKSGLRLQITSTTDSGHAHEWSILGGNYLYDSLCYNCHSNDQRGSRGMADRPSTNQQRNALQNPGAMLLSTSPAADPTSQPTTTTLDGAALYDANCAICHNVLATSTKRQRTASTIKTAITTNAGGMGNLTGLSDAQLQAIATALQ
jgi:mono/diheme cytochrome c family protein